MSKFSAIRASQVPDSELKGIKAENLHVQNLSVREHQPEPPSPNSVFSFSTPPLSPSSPRRPQNHRLNSSRTSFGSLSHSRSIESFSQPGSRPYKSPPTAIVPPPRISSKRSTPELNAHQSSTSTLIKPCSVSKNPTSPISPTSCTVLEWEDELIDYSTAPHAVSTPDETALTLMPAPSGTVRTELSDVPEENEVSRWRKAPALMSYPSTPRSGLGHSKSFSTTLSSPHRGSIGSYSTSAYSPISPMSDAPHWTESVIPLVDQQLDDIPTQPMLSRCISVSLNGSEFCWEDDIDYCYEHAAEADCEFDWERVTKNEETAAKIINSSDSNAETAKESLKTAKHEVSNNPAPLTSSYLRFSTIDSEAPILKPEASPRHSTKSSTDSLAGPITPSRSLSSPLGSALPLGPSKRSNPPDFTPSLFVSGDFETAIMPEEMYQRILSGDHVSEQHYAFGSDCLDAPSTRDSSPRSSHLPVSKSNSQESFFLSQSISSLYRHRDSSSVSSLPELVYSRKEAPNSDFVVADVGDPITAPVNSVPPPGVLPTPQVRPRRSTSLAKEVAHLSVLQKIMGSSAVLTQEKILPSAPHYHQLHHEKPLPLTPS